MNVAAQGCFDIARTPDIHEQVWGREPLWLSSNVQAGLPSRSCTPAEVFWDAAGGMLEAGGGAGSPKSSRSPSRSCCCACAAAACPSGRMPEVVPVRSQNAQGDVMVISKDAMHCRQSYQSGCGPYGTQYCGILDMLVLLPCMIQPTFWLA